MVRVPRHGAALGINDQDISRVTPMTAAGAPNGRQTQGVDVGHYLDETVYPALFDRLAGAFPEFGWQSHDMHWTATTFPAGFPFPVEHPRPDRLMVYADRPWWIKLHGHSGVRFLDYVNGGRRPTGAEFPAAVRELCKRAGVPFPEREWTPEQAARLQQREQRRLALEAVIAAAELTLWSPAGSDARAYLVKRGFTEAALRDLRVGLYHTSAARAACTATGLSAADIKAARIVTPKLEGYIVFLWNNATGQPLTIYGRSPGTPPADQPKTMALSGEGTKAAPLYFDRARHAGHRHLVAVEGVIDAALLQALGETCVVAYVAAQFSGAQLETLARFGVEAVTIVPDPDTGGDRGVLSSLHGLTAHGIRAYVAARLPDGLDPDELVLRDGIEAFRHLVAEAVPGAMHEADVILRSITPGSPPVERDAALAEVRALVDRLDGPALVDRDAVLSLTAERSGIRAETLRVLLTGGEDATARRAHPGAEQAYGPAGGDDAKHPEGGNSAYSTYSASPTQAWETPIEFNGMVYGPTLPMEALPPIIGDFVAAVADVHQVPADLVAAVALGVMAAAARDAVVHIGTTHHEPVNLYMAPTAEPGERKAQAIRECVGPLEDIEHRLIAEKLPEIARANQLRAIAEKRLKHLQDVAAKEKDSAKRARLTTEVAEFGAELPDVPSYPQLIFDDVTVEATAKALAEQGACIAIISEEAGGLFETLGGKYSKKGEPSLDVHLKGYDGGMVRVTRVGRSPLKIEHPCITIVVTPQPVVLDNIAAHPELRARGLVGRITIVLPSSLVGQRKYQRNARISTETRTAYTNAIEQLFAGAGATIRIEGEALDEWERYYWRIERAMADGGSLSHIKDWATKHPGRVARIVGTLHLVKRSDPTDDKPTAETVAQACVIGDWLVEHALAAFGRMSSDPCTRLARWILAWIRRKQLEKFTLRDLANDKRDVPTPEDFLPGLDLLEGRHFIRREPEEQPTGKRGRKPSPSFSVNPATLTQNTHNTQNSPAEAANGEFPETPEPTVPA
jgi:hypothetical protein